MAVVTRKVSDLTGAEAKEEEFAVVIVRQHPKVTEPKRLDALPAELDDLKSVGDLVILEIKMPDGTSRELHLKYADFAKLVTDDALAKAPGVKGRIPGTRMNNGH